MNEEDAKIVSKIAAALSNLMTILEDKGIISETEFREIVKAAAYMGEYDSDSLVNRLTGKDKQ